MNAERHKQDPGEVDPGVLGERAKRTILQRIRASFIAGVVVMAPIAITLYLVWLFVNAVDDSIRPLIPAKYNPETYLPFYLPGFGLVVLIVVVTLVGALAANFFGRFVLRAGERILDRMPVVRSIYGPLKQIFRTLVSKSSSSFQHVVLVEYPRKDLWAIAFMTSDTKGEVHRRTGRNLVNVFLPTTPNPTSGYLLFVPREDLVFLDMTVEEGIKKVISAGLVTPPDRGGTVGGGGEPERLPPAD